MHAIIVGVELYFWALWSAFSFSRSAINASSKSQDGAATNSIVDVNFYFSATALIIIAIWVDNNRRRNSCWLVGGVIVSLVRRRRSVWLDVVVMGVYVVITALRFGIREMMIRALALRIGWRVISWLGHN